MEQYTLKLSQGTSYKLYEGTTLMPDAELEALFASNGSAYFVFDFDGSTPSSTTTVQIVDSTDEMIIEKTSVNVRDDRNYKGTWSGTTTFDSFEVLSGKSLDEYQVKFLMSEIKKPVGADRIDSSAVTESKIANSAVTTNKLADGSVTGAANAAVDVTGSKVALSTVGTPNMRDSAITTAKLADNAVTTAKITDANVTSAKLADSAVTTAKIANAAVTSGKIANGAVTAEKLDTGFLEDIAYIGEDVSTPSDVAYVKTYNIVDGAVTVDKLSPSTFYDVLYNGSSVTGDVTLSDDPTKYTRLKIYGVTSDILQFSYEVYAPVDGNIFSIFVQNLNSSGCWIKSARYTIDASNNKLVKDIYRGGQYTAPVGSGGVGSVDVDMTYIRIKRVEGWKF